MGKKNWLVVAILAAILVITLGTTSVFAHDSTETDGDTGGFRGSMHEACENGDWEAMAELHEQYHNEEGESCWTTGGGMMGDWDSHGDMMDGWNNMMGDWSGHGGMMGGGRGMMGGGMMGRW